MTQDNANNFDNANNANNTNNANSFNNANNANNADEWCLSKAGASWPVGLVELIVNVTIYVFYINYKFQYNKNLLLHSMPMCQ